MRMSENFAVNFAMANIQDEELVEEFDIFGVELTDADIFDKLKELCSLYRLSAEKVASEWAAYSHTRGTISISLNHLDSLEKQIGNKKSNKSSKTPARKPTKIYTADDALEAFSADVEDQLVDAYATPHQKQKGQKRQITPEVVNRKRVADLSRNSAAPFSPSSFSPTGSSPSTKYTSRKNAGEVITSFGDVAKVNWTAEKRSCKVSLYDQSLRPESTMKYMYQKITDKIQVLDGLIEDMAACLREKHSIEHLTPAALPMQEEASVVCRVCCDSEGKLNAKSIVLEDSMEMSGGKNVPLDVSAVKSYSLFPGQVIAVDGLNTSGQKFVAKKIHAGVPPSEPGSNLTGDDSLNVLIACGPFTTSDSLVYEPLEDLKKCIRTQRPNVCILMGPFVDAANENFEKENIEESFEDIFKGLVSSLVKETERFSSQLILIPSQRDLHHECVYPQPAYTLEKTDPRVHLMMDPCIVDIEGVVFGVTSTDVLFQLGCEEISNHPPGSSDRMARLVSHLLSQRSFYPLYPPSLDVCMDYELFEKYGKMPVLPHVLITPSDLKQFVKDVNGCCCINPGKLTKGMSAGSYSRLIIKPGLKEKLSLSSQVVAQVLRI